MVDKEHETKFGWRPFLNFLKDKFNLDEDKATQDEVAENISKGVEFKGTNLWVLIFATFVASLGLNMNSAAVIIGAMLISPLMGPIMGIGLSLGVYDFELMKRSLRNFGFMVLISIITSTIYFYLSPLSNAQSELLARTSPTVYDVLIAFFGGLAGIVAQSRKDRTTIVIPGVAIATALMPPLCTAGFGIATGQWSFFFGAFYLFFINTVFIALATYIIVRFLKYSRKQFLNKARERRVKQYMYTIILLTLIPSIILAYGIVQKSIFENNADRFVNSVFKFDKTQVVDCKKVYRTRHDNAHIDVLLIGEPISKEMIENFRAQMVFYGLSNTDLIVKQADGTEKIDINTLQVSYTQLLDEKNRQIQEMETQLQKYNRDTLAYADISREAAVVVDNIKRLSFSKQPVLDTKGTIVDTMLVCIVKPVGESEPIDKKRLAEWLKQRTKSKEVRIFLE